MLPALRDRTFRRLLSAHLVALLGTGLSTIAIGFLAFDVVGAGAAAVVGSLLAIKMLAFLLLAPVAPAIAARVGPRRLLIATDVVRAAVALALPFVGDLVVAIVLVVVLQSASALFTPTFQAVVPTVLPEQRAYTGGLALSRLAYDLEALATPMLAALVLLVAPSWALFLGTAAGFLGSAMLLLSVALPAWPAIAREAGGFRAETTRGIRLVLRDRALRGVLAVHLALACVGAIPAVLTVPLVRGELGGDAAQAAGLLAALGAGSVVSALIMPLAVARIGTQRFVLTGLAAAIAAMAGVWPVLAASADPASALGWLHPLWFLAGMGAAAVLAPMGRVVRETVGDAELPFAFAAQFALAHGWWLVTYPLAGWGATVLGYGAATAALALAAAMVGGVAAAMWLAASRVAAAGVAPAAGREDGSPA